MANLISRFLLSLLIGLGLAFGFNFLFLELASRPAVDQALLLFFSTASFGYLVFFLMESRHQTPDSLRLKNMAFDREKMISFLRENMAGLLLGIVFFMIYTYIGLKLNHATI